jgi:hypothetical protein
MTNPDLTTPPEKLFAKWEDDILNERENVDVVLDCAWENGFAAGADQELEACVEWLGDAPVVYDNNSYLHPGSYLRDARRPKPPSLKAQALAALVAINSIVAINSNFYLYGEDFDTIRRALEALPND